ncbi:hypothetical protein [Streptosporangium sp. NPDC000396]|uniref:hypothetical protein n=1 Tax=Streptosporangium sp. NPDC000396 TaxID=3366185 RepID=UPI0036AD06AC
MTALVSTSPLSSARPKSWMGLGLRLTALVAPAAAGAGGLNVVAFHVANRSGSRQATGLVAIGSAAGGTGGVFAGAVVMNLLSWQAVLALPLLSLLAVPAALGLAESGRSRAPFFPPLAVLREKTFLVATVLMLALATVNFGLVYAAPSRLAALSGWSAVQTGIASSAASFAGAMLSWTLVRTAPRLGPVGLRAVLMAASVAALVLAGCGPWVAGLLLGSAAGSFSAASGQGVLIGPAIADLPEEHRPAVIGLFNLAFLLGTAAGPALASLLNQTV